MSDETTYQTPMPTLIAGMPPEDHYYSIGHVGNYIRAVPEQLGYAIRDLGIEFDHVTNGVPYLSYNAFHELVRYFNRTRKQSDVTE